MTTLAYRANKYSRAERWGIITLLLLLLVEQEWTIGGATVVALSALTAALMAYQAVKQG